MNNEIKHDIEEDWSEIMSGETTGFAQHGAVVVRVSPSRTLSISCVTALSPLDMMNLSNGNHDATGHRIWLGAYMFIEAIARNDYIKSLFRPEGTSVLELGCGSGVSGLAVLCDPSGSPSHIMFTDSDPAALELCRRNCRSNLPCDDKRTRIASLVWGKSLGCPYDVVLATDILYDISSLEPMLLTIASTLKRSGYFVMSHVPRACLPGEEKVASAEKLELFIVDNAQKYNLELKRIVRLEDLCNSIHDKALNDVSFQQMKEAGAAILVFTFCD